MFPVNNNSLQSMLMHNVVNFDAEVAMFPPPASEFHPYSASHHPDNSYYSGTDSYLAEALTSLEYAAAVDNMYRLQSSRRSTLSHPAPFLPRRRPKNNLPSGAPRPFGMRTNNKRPATTSFQQQPQFKAYPPPTRQPQELSKTQEESMMSAAYEPIDVFNNSDEPVVESDEIASLAQFRSDEFGEFSVEGCCDNRDSSFEGQATTRNDQLGLPHAGTDTPSPKSDPNKDSGPKMLGHSFQPGSWDVICGRGKACYDNIGNRRLRILVALNLARYVETEKRGVKTAVVNDIVNLICNASETGTGFVRRHTTPGNSNNNNDNGDRWYKIGTAAARERVGHAIRDCLSEPLRNRSKDTMPASERAACLRSAQQEVLKSSITTLRCQYLK